MVNLHLGIAHSFSDHLFSSVGVQGDAKFFDWFGAGISRKSDGWLGSFSIGYYSKGERKCGYEIIPCIAYEKNSVGISNYKSFGGATYDNWFEYANSSYVIPSLQTSFYIKGLKANFYSTVRFSYLFSDVTYPHIQYYNAPELRKYFPETYLIEPAIQFSFSHSKTMRYFISAHITKSKNYYLDFIPPFQAGFKFMIE